MDDHYVLENPVLGHPSWASAGIVFREVFKSSTVDGYYEPLTLLSLMLDVGLGGRADNLRPFHVTSLLLHLFNTTLIIVLLYMLFGRPWLAAAVGLLFAVHPLTVEPLAWIWERKTLLAGFFALWCLILYIRYTRRPGLAVYLGVLVMFVLAVMAKPTVTPLPVLLLLLDFWPLRRLTGKAVLEKRPFFAIAVVSSIITVISTASTGGVALPAGYSLVQFPLKVCYLIGFYLCKIFWPVNLSSIYVLSQPMSLSQPLVLVAVAGTCTLILLLAVLLRWTRAPATGGLFFIVAMFPTLGVVQYSWVVASDKYVYIPAIGLLMILAWLLAQLAGDTEKPRPTWRPASVGVGVVALAVLLIVDTRQYLREWQTTERHEFYMRRLAPNSPYSNYACGNVLKDRGNYALAIPYYTMAIKLKPDFAQACYNRGNACKDGGAYEQAIQDYTRAIALKPDYVDAYNNRGFTYDKKGAYEQAIRDYNKAIELAPDYAGVYSNRGVTYSNMGAYDQAIRDYFKAIELRPDYADAYYNRGCAYKAKGDYVQAIRDYTRGVELKPDDAQAYYDRGTAFFLTQHYDNAWADVKKCRQLGGQADPDFIKALTQASSRPE